MDTNVKSESPLVSILMLTWNRSNYIKGAIKSVLSQDYTHWELFVIDDGSTDDTHAIMLEFGNDSRIHYIKHESQEGLLARRKESLTYPTGKYVAVLDSDDLWVDTRKLSAQVEILEKDANLAIVGTFIHLINGIDAIVGKVAYGKTDNEIRNNLLSKNQFAHSSVLMRADLLRKTKGYTTRLSEDFELFLSLGELGRMYNISSPMTAYRVHPGGESSNLIGMSVVAHEIIKKHGHAYPHFVIAYIRSITRIVTAYFKMIFNVSRT